MRFHQRLLPGGNRADAQPPGNHELRFEGSGHTNIDLTTGAGYVVITNVVPVFSGVLALNAWSILCENTMVTDQWPLLPGPLLGSVLLARDVPAK